MSCSSFFREEFEHETSSTRKILAALPESNFGWKPHEKSLTLGQLAGHVAEQPFWVSLILETDSFELMPDGAPAFESFLPKTREQLLATFDANVKQARELLSKVEDEQLKQTWTLLFKREAHCEQSPLWDASLPGDEPPDPSQSATHGISEAYEYSRSRTLRTFRRRSGNGWIVRPV